MFPTEFHENETLAKLWKFLVRPIFEAMDILDTNASKARRDWLCPVGSLSSLPLHAAGIYHNDGSSNAHVGKYAVCSYAPTLSVLHRMLHEPASQQLGELTSAKMLLIAQPDSEATHSASLPYARLEAECVEDIVPLESHVGLQCQTLGMSVDAALESVADAHILHIACHGHQNQDNPLDSGFDLQDGRLTLGQLMRVNIPNARLAYLSACESAGMDESRPDEGLNLAGAMIFVGFKSVVATMWAMDDIDGPFMAEHIYQRIFRDGKLDLHAVPHAINDAVQKLRESGVPASRWATYVHIGV